MFRVRCAITLSVVALIFSACSDGVTRPDVPPTRMETQSALTQEQSTTSWTIDDEFDRLAREEIPGFGGFFFDENSNPVVYLTNPTQRAAAERWVAQVQARLGVPGRVMVVRQAKYDFTELKRWHDQLLPMLVRDDVHWLDVDETSNVVRIAVQNAAAIGSVRAEVAATDVPSDAARVEMHPQPVQRLTVRQYTRPVDGGFQIQNVSGATCTLGFNAVLPSGAPVFFTASHCSQINNSAPDGSLEFQPGNTVPSHEIGYEVLDRQLYNCGLGVNCRWSDASGFAYNVGVPYRLGYIARTANYGVNARGSLVVHTSNPFTIKNKVDRPVYVGTWINKVGRTSGWTRGPITQTCVTLEDLRCQYVASVWSEPGDSGSPLFVAGGVTASWRELNSHVAVLYGLLWGGPPGVYTTTWYSPVDGIESDLGSFFVCIQPGNAGCLPPLNVSISGPSEVPPDELCVWEANVSNGVPPFTITWSGVLTGSGDWIEGSLTSSGTLTAWVTDAIGRTDGDNFEIQVTGGSEGEGCEA